MVERVPVDRLFDVPDGRIQRADEVHDPDNWVRCANCGLGNPTDFENCFDCAEPITE